MCGIAGFIDDRGFDTAQAVHIGHSIANAMLHRGPDSVGLWTDVRAKTCFVHRRLAVVDLSAEGHQPMTSGSGRYVISYNGEIYNHIQLRAELEQNSLSPAWRGHSDTETLLACLDAYGLETTLKKTLGMFAFAVYDQHNSHVFLARDRMGEKPLYYGRQGSVSFFASELKAIRSHPDFDATIDRSALCSYLRHNYIPAPNSIYSGIKKLPAGCFVRLHDDDVPISYWTLDEAIRKGLANPYAGTEDSILNGLDDLLRSAVGFQMQADVPLGAFLSGGVDSSLIVALMQEQSERRVKTFSIGFENKQFNEAPFAKAVAKHIGTDHTELYLTGEDALNVIPKLPAIYDEPFSDSSQIPTYLVSKMARDHVTVSLSGDAGDELFGGYNRYQWGQSIWSMMRFCPRSIRSMLASIMCAVPPDGLNTMFHPLAGLLPQRIRPMNVGDKIHKAASILCAGSQMELYLQLISHWKSPSKVVLGGNECERVLNLVNAPRSDLNFSQSMMWLDSLTYLPDDILTKVDRAAMSVSLETRVPFLDHRVVEASWRLPNDMRIRNGQGKWALRELLYRRVPKSLIERPKTGFGVPLDAWLRGPLKEWAASLLDETRIKQAGYFDVLPIQQKWKEHLSGQRNWHYYLWDILMFEAWRDEVAK